MSEDSDYNDMDSADWESIMGGPEDEFWDPPAQREQLGFYPDAEEDYEDYHRSGGVRWLTARQRNAMRSRFFEEERRLKDIMAWLEKSGAARPFRNGRGFFVPAGERARFQSGEVWEIVSWLRKEWFEDRGSVLNYTVKFNPPGSRFGEGFTFIRNIHDAYHGWRHPASQDGNDLVFDNPPDDLTRAFLESPEEETRRKAENIFRVLKWLQEKGVARPFKKIKGFFVSRGEFIKFESRRKLEVIDWLLSQGFSDLHTVGEYTIVYNPPGENLGETFSFFENVHNAPFCWDSHDDIAIRDYDISIDAKESNEDHWSDDLPF